MPLRGTIEDQLNRRVFGTATAGSKLTVPAMITNVNAVDFELDNVMVHAIGKLDDLGDDALFVAAKNWAVVPSSELSESDLPKQAYTHGRLKDAKNREYDILSLSTDGSLLRLFLSSQLV